MAIERVDRVRYPAIGHCIYCGSDGAGNGLRDEHILPFALGGNAVLPAASCKECERVTSYLDGVVARGVFHDFRIHAGIQTRRPKERPSHLPATVLLHGSEETRLFPINDHPHTLVLPLLRRPGLLRGVAPDSGFHGVKTARWWHHPDTLRMALGVSEDTPVSTRDKGQYSLSAFARAMVKIAYCNGVATGILKPQKSCLTDLILGFNDRLSFFVGSDGYKLPPPGPRDISHTVVYQEWTRPEATFVVAEIRLFASSGTDDHGMPTYLVVINSSPKSLQDFLDNSKLRRIRKTPPDFMRRRG